MVAGKTQWLASAVVRTGGPKLAALFQFHVLWGLVRQNSKSTCIITRLLGDIFKLLARM